MTSPSTAWNSATAFTNRSRLSRRAARRRADRRGQLDVDAGGVDDPADQVEQRLADVRRAACAARRRAARTARAPRRSRPRSPGSSSASSSDGDLGRVDALGDRGRAGRRASRRRGRGRRARPARRRAGRAARRSRGPIAHRGPVSRVSSAALAVRSWSSVQGGDHLGDLGQPQQPVEADDLDRDLALGQRVEDVGGVRVVAGQHADLAPRASRRVAWASRTWSASQASSRRRSRARAARTSPASAPRLGSSGAPRRSCGVAAARPGALATSRMRRVGAPVDRERVRRRRPPVGGGKSSREVEDVGDRGAAPAVDRLVGVADRGDRMAAAVSPSGRRTARRASAPGRPRCPGTRRAARRGTSSRSSAPDLGLVARPAARPSAIWSEKSISPSSALSRR